MPYDYQAAKSSGMSDEEIAAYLSQKHGYAYDEAVASGVPVQEIVQHLMEKEAPQGEDLFRGAKEAFKATTAPLLFVADRLAQAGSQAAGRTIKAASEGDVLSMPLEYGTGLVRGAMGLPGPQATEEIRRLGYAGLSPEQRAIGNAIGTAGGMTAPVGDIAGALTSPEAAGTVASTLATLPLDVVGGAALKGGRALTQIPRVAEALDVARGVTAPVGRLVSRGYALGHKVREPLRQIVRGARGEERLLEAQFSDLLDEAQAAILSAAKKKGIDPTAAEAEVRHLLEVGTRDPRALALATPEDRAAVVALSDLRDIMPRLRTAAGVKQRRLGGPLGVAAGQVEFVPRIFTPKAAKTLGLGKGNVEYSELGTPIPGIRKGNRVLTTGGIEAQLERGVAARGPVKDAFEPLLRSFEMKGRQTARSVANAKALSEIARRFGKGAADAGPGWKKLSDLGTLKGLTKQGQAALSDVHVDPEVFRYLDEFTRETGPAQIPLLSGFLRAWKPLVTTVNPQFMSRNFQWNGVIGWIRGNRDPRNWTDAAEVLSRSGPFNNIRGFRVTNEELRDEMLRNGIVGQGTMAEFGTSGRRILRGAEKLSPARISRVGTRINQAGEDLSRASFYIAKRRAGMSPVAAAKEVRLTYFDYGRDAVSPFIQGMRESAIPFAVWARNILPLTFRTLVEKPSAFAGLGALGRESARASGIRPEDRPRMGPEFKEVPAIHLKGEKPGRYGAVPLSQVGFFDVSRALSDPRKYTMTQLSPLIAGPLEVAGIIKNAFTGKQSDDIVELPPVAGKFAQMNPGAAKKLGITYAQDGRATGPQWMNTVLRAGGPLGTTVFDLWSDDPKARLRVVRWLSGISKRENLSPEKGRRIEQLTSTEKNAQGQTIGKLPRREEKRHRRQGQRIIQEIKRGER